MDSSKQRRNEAGAGIAGATAGLRGAHWNPARLPSATHLSTHALPTDDGAVTCGHLFTTNASTSTVVCLMHPREVLVSHYLVPDILRAGAAAWVQGPRSPGNDLRLEHEIALLDVAAGLKFLRSQGFRNIVLLGNSGGAGLYAFYNQQSLLAPEQRLETTPAGRPTGLATAELPVADGLVFVSPHPGQGRLLMNAIDPSLTNEDDAKSVDPGLDPFSAANGFRPAPQSSTYSAEFVTRYRLAQRERVRRIDERAHALLDFRKRARVRAKQTGDRNDVIDSLHMPIMTIWRTDADLRCYDLSLDPSRRAYGSLWGRNPIASNYGSLGFARLCTPESWLSTWSGLSSRAVVETCAQAIEQPALMIVYSGDNCVFPSDLDAIYAGIRTTRKERARFDGDHHGRPLHPGEQGGQLPAGERLGTWLRDHFATRALPAN